MTAKLPNSQRTRKGEALYQREKRLGLTKPLQDEPAIITWKYWKLIANRYPYDAVYVDHDLLVPLREFSDRDHMKLVEWIEFSAILNELENQYDRWFENFPGKRSVKNVWHAHLVRDKLRSTKGSKK